jgi:hypothetical protein
LFCGDCAPVDTVRQGATVKMSGPISAWIEGGVGQQQAPPPSRVEIRTRVRSDPDRKPARTVTAADKWNMTEVVLSGARSTQTVSTTSSLRCGRRSRPATSLIAERPPLTIRVTTAKAIDRRRRAPQPHWPPTGTTEPDHRGRRRTGGDVLRLIKRPACDSECVGLYHGGRLDSNATRVDWPGRNRPGRFCPLKQTIRRRSANPTRRPSASETLGKACTQSPSVL